MTTHSQQAAQASGMTLNASVQVAPSLLVEARAAKSFEIAKAAELTKSGQ